MTERQKLLAAIAQLTAPDEPVVLATVVKIEGSAYRRPGARMLIPRYGSAVGTLSGGCLESAVSKKAWWLTEAGHAVVCRYATATMTVNGEEPADDEAELSFGLGCNGAVHVLLERIERPQQAAQFALLRSVEQQQQPAALAVVISKSAELATNIGERIWISPSGDCHGQFQDAALTAQVRLDLQRVLQAERTELVSYRRGNQHTELLLEYLPPLAELVLIGAGHDAVPLVQLAKRLGWRVTVIDGRGHFARPERFPEADRVLVLNADAALVEELVPAHAAVVVMSHSFAQDRAWLQRLLRRPLRYLGQLGPRSRTERLLSDFTSDADLPAALAGLHAPVGLDLGGSTPEAVALAILAEVQAALNQRAGGKLSARQAAIHSPELQSVCELPAQPTAATTNRREPVSR